MSKENTIILDIMKDFLYYGYTFKSFLDMDYPITKNKSIEELQKLWQQAINIMARF